MWNRRLTILATLALISTALVFVQRVVRAASEGTAFAGSRIAVVEGVERWSLEAAGLRVVPGDDPASLEATFAWRIGDREWEAFPADGVRYEAPAAAVRPSSLGLLSRDWAHSLTAGGVQSIDRPGVVEVPADSLADSTFVFAWNVLDVTGARIDSKAFHRDRSRGCRSDFVAWPESLVNPRPRGEGPELRIEGRRATLFDRFAFDDGTPLDLRMTVVESVP